MSFPVIYICTFNNLLMTAMMVVSSGYGCVDSSVFATHFTSCLWWVLSAVNVQEPSVSYNPLFRVEVGSVTPVEGIALDTNHWIDGAGLVPCTEHCKVYCVPWSTVSAPPTSLPDCKSCTSLGGTGRRQQNRNKWKYSNPTTTSKGFEKDLQPFKKSS